MRHTRSSRRSRQSGFTLVEVMVALVLVAVLGALFVGATGVSARIDKANMTAAQNQIANLIVQETVAFYARRRSLSGLATTDMSVSTATPWGDTWSISARTASTATFSYPMDGADDTLGADLAAYLSGMTSTSAINSASYTAATNILAFTVSM